MTVAISNLSATWSNSSITYNAISMNVSNTGANNRSSLLSLSINGNNVFRISGDGKLRLGAANNFTVANPSVSGGAYAERVFNIIDRGPTLKIAAIDSDTGIELVRYNTAANAVTTFMAVYGTANSLIVQDRTTGPAYTLMNVTNTLITFSRDTNISGNVNAQYFIGDGSGLVGVGAANIMEYKTPGNYTWTKPLGVKMVWVRVWAGGGSGARGQNDVAGGGGGGGGYAEKYYLASNLSDTESVVVGSGGAARTTATTSGANGTNSSFSTGGNLLEVGGGERGLYSSSVPNGGRGGAGYSTTKFIIEIGAEGGAGRVDLSGDTGEAGYFAGGGGGGGGDSSANTTTTQSGGASTFGGGGGGGGSERGEFQNGGRAPGGTSRYGGNGGAGNTGTGIATSGQEPGGGGGGSEEGNSGAGANGWVFIYSW